MVEISIRKDSPWDGPCEVVEKRCEWLKCLRPGYHTIRSYVGFDGYRARVDDSRVVCVHNADYGCPLEEEKIPYKLTELHENGKPKFSQIVRKPSHSKMKCQCGCGKSFPRWMVYEWQNEQQSE